MTQAQLTRSKAWSMDRPALRGRYLRVVQQLGLRVAAGRLSAGDQVSPEELCAEFNVSRPVIREALRVLQDKGMVEARPRTGTRIRPIEEWDLLDRDVILWRLDGPDRLAQFADLIGLRAAIEPLAAVGCCEHATPQDCLALFDLCDTIASAITDGDAEQFTAADIAFHLRLLTASGNLLFEQFTGAIEAVLQARDELDLLPEQLDPAAHASHRALAEAIADRDKERAERLAREIAQLAGSEIIGSLQPPLT